MKTGLTRSATSNLVDSNGLCINFEDRRGKHLLLLNICDVGDE